MKNDLITTEFPLKKNVKIVVDFVKGEEVLITGFSAKVDGRHTIEELKTHFGGCESGILAKVSGYDSFLDIGWLCKL